MSDKTRTAWNKGIKNPSIAGDKHPCWKGGKNNCADCGKLLSNRVAKRCKSCAAKGNKFSLGIVRTEEWKHSLSLSCKGRVMTTKGKSWSESRREAQKFVIKKIKTVSRRTIKKEVLYSDDWIEIRRSIYERDKWTCVECSIKCHGNGTKDKIQCHHIDYNKHNCIAENLITLCASCHCKTNFNRGYWMNKFNKQEILLKSIIAI